MSVCPKSWFNKFTLGEQSPKPVTRTIKASYNLESSCTTARERTIFNYEFYLVCNHMLVVASNPSYDGTLPINVWASKDFLIYVSLIGVYWLRYDIRLPHNKLLCHSSTRSQTKCNWTASNSCKPDNAWTELRWRWYLHLVETSGKGLQRQINRKKAITKNSSVTPISNG